MAWRTTRRKILISTQVAAGHGASIGEGRGQVHPRRARAAGGGVRSWFGCAAEHAAACRSEVDLGEVFPDDEASVAVWIRPIGGQGGASPAARVRAYRTQETDRQVHPQARSDEASGPS